MVCERLLVVREIDEAIHQQKKNCHSKMARVRRIAEVISLRQITGRDIYRPDQTLRQFLAHGSHRILRPRAPPQNPVTAHGLELAASQRKI